MEEHRELQPLDYGRPPAVKRRLPAQFSLGTFLYTFAFGVVLLTILALVVPRFETIFADFGMKLPAVTQILLDVSRALQSVIGLVVGGLVILGAAAGMAMLPVSGRWLRLILVVFLAVIVLVIVLALFLPMVHLIENISSPKK